MVCYVINEIDRYNISFDKVAQPDRSTPHWKWRAFVGGFTALAGLTVSTPGLDVSANAINRPPVPF